MVQKREENLRKIQQLGSLPTAELEAHSSSNVKELMKELHKTNKSLTKYSHVNKKALDQYVNFSEQRETLLQVCALKLGRGQGRGRLGLGLGLL